MNHSEQSLSNLFSCFSLGEVGSGEEEKSLGTELFYCANLKAIACCLRGLDGGTEAEP